MGQFTGTRFSAGDQGVTEARIVTDLGDDIFMLEPDKNPLTLLLNKLSRRDVKNGKVMWQEQNPLASWDTIQTAIATDATTATPTELTSFNVGQLWKIPRTGDVFRVTTVSDPHINISRISGNNTSTTAEPIMRMTPVYMEGADKPTALSKNVDTVYNWIQEMAWSYAVSKRMQNTKMYGPTELARLQRFHAIEAAKDIERGAFFGKRAETTTGTEIYYFAGGFFQYVSTNVVSVGGALTHTNLQDLSRMVFRYGSKTKLLFCGYKLINGLDRLGEAKLQLVPKDQVYGLDCKQFLSNYGRLLIFNHWLFEGATYAGYGCCVDPENVKLAVMQDIQHEDNVQTPGARRVENQFTAMLSWEWALELAHGYMTGVTG